jgi:exopolysaccharide biosynthesis polyprenyl glycosylphosphotransferase
MIWRPSFHRRILQAADGLTTALSFFVAYLLWDQFRRLTNISLPLSIAGGSIAFVAVFSFAWVFILSRLGAYSYGRLTSLWREWRNIALATVLGVFLFFAAHFFLRLGYIARSYVLIFGAVNFLFLSLEKTVLFYVVREARKRELGKRRILIAGGGEHARIFLESVGRHPASGVTVAGLVSEEPGAVIPGFPEVRNLGTYDEIETILHGRIVDEVLICISWEAFGPIRKIIECCEREGVQVRIFSDFFGDLIRRIRLDRPYGMNIISLITLPDNEFRLAVKRLMDLAGSGLLLLLLSPLFLIVALLVKATSKGPVLYRWNVVGLNKKPFRSWKFRTMIANADLMKDELMDRNEMRGPAFKMKDDPRITKIGKFLRKYSLDEIPQLWSVFKGDMSLVGPRPSYPDELARFESWHRRKLSVKPGMTCLWQIRGRNRIADFDTWVRLDLEYIESWSLWLDLKILIKTIPAVIRGTGI